MQVCAKVSVSGQVQGVFYRDFTWRRAIDLNLVGWVRNLPDGRVEAVFAGDAKSVTALVSWCRKGPQSSVVTECLVNEEPVDQGLLKRGFRIEY